MYYNGVRADIYFGGYGFISMSGYACGSYHKCVWCYQAFQHMSIPECTAYNPRHTAIVSNALIITQISGTYILQFCPKLTLYWMTMLLLQLCLACCITVMTRESVST